MSRTGRDLSVLHVGPSSDGPGGMSTVIKTLVETAPYQSSAMATWIAGSSIRTWRAWLAALWQIMVDRRLPAVLHAHVSEGGSWLREGSLVLAAKHVRRRRTVITLHGADFRQGLQARTMRFLVGLIGNNCDAVFVLSEDDRGALRALVRADVPVVRISNPVSVGPGTPRADSLPGRPFALFLGERSARKGLDLLLDSWASLPDKKDVTLVVAGPPGDVEVPDRDDLVDMGAVDYPTARHLTAHARAVILPSRAEALPMVILEAMASGTAFVATDISGISDLKGSGAGIVIPPRSVEDLTRALDEVVKGGALSALARNGRAWWAANASPQAVHGQLFSYYDR